MRYEDLTADDLDELMDALHQFRGDPFTADDLAKMMDAPFTADDLAELMDALSAPPVIDGLAASFASETRNLADGLATRYIDGQVFISWPRPEGGGAHICQVRQRPRGGKLGAWRTWRVADEPGPSVAVRQRASDYEGATYDLRVRPLDGADWAQAVVDWPPGIDTQALSGQERTAAWCLARTATMILIWIRADRQTPAVAIESAYSLRGGEGVEDWGGPVLHGPGASAFRLIRELDQATEYELTLTIKTGLIVERELIDPASETLTLTTRTLGA